MHPNNPHKERYDLKVLQAKAPKLSPFIFINQYGKETINFHDPEAVKQLNTALLKHHYGITHWDIPEGYLCPPIPGRMDYLLYIADLLAGETGKIPRGSGIKLLDIGTGANCIYPILGHQYFGWSYVGSEIDQKAYHNANELIIRNGLSNDISIRLQSDATKILEGIVRKPEVFDVVICNPPFHADLKEAQKASTRKSRNLGRSKANRPNFGGQLNELCYEGGEIKFIERYIEESRKFSRSAYWYTTLVSKASNIGKIKSLLSRQKPAEYQVIEMEQGNKTSRMMTWTFLPHKTRRIWEENRWRQS